MLRRVMGKLAFLTLRDESGTIQLYVEKNVLEADNEGAYACVLHFIIPLSAGLTERPPID